MTFPHAFRIHCLAAAGIMMWITPGANAGEGIPALLQFAEHYHGLTPFSSAAKTGGREQPQTQHTKSKTTHRTDELQLTLRQQNARLARQQATIHTQENQLITLRKSLQISKSQLMKANQHITRTLSIADNQYAPTDFTPLLQLISRLRDAAAGLPDTRKSAELVLQARKEVERSRNDMSHSQDLVSTLTAQLDELRTKEEQQRINLRELEADKFALQMKLEALQQQATASATLYNRHEKDMDVCIMRIGSYA